MFFFPSIIAGLWGIKLMLRAPERREREEKEGEERSMKRERERGVESCVSLKVIEQGLWSKGRSPSFSPMNSLYLRIWLWLSLKIRINDRRKTNWKSIFPVYQRDEPVHTEVVMYGRDFADINNGLMMTSPPPNLMPCWSSVHSHIQLIFTKHKEIHSDTHSSGAVIRQSDYLARQHGCSGHLSAAPDAAVCLYLHKKWSNKECTRH